MNIKFDKIIETYIPLLSILLLAYGIVFNLYYYQKFNITITDYIELGESLLLFISSLPRIIFYIPFLIVALSTIAPSVLKNEKIENHFFYSSLLEGVMLKKKFVIWYSIINISICLILLFLSELLHLKSFLFFGYAFAMQFIISFVPLVFRLIYDAFIEKGRKVPVEMPIILYNIILLFISTLYTADLKERRVLNSIRNPKVSIVINEKIIKTDSVIVYIGKTKDYIFLYNKSQKRTSVIFLSEVSELNFEE